MDGVLYTPLRECGKEKVKSLTPEIGSGRGSVKRLKHELIDYSECCHRI